MKTRGSVRNDILILLFFAVIGVLRILPIQNMGIILPGEIQGIIAKPPRVSGTYQIIQLRVPSTLKYFTVITNQYPSYQYGDILQIKAKKGEGETLFYPEIEIVGSRKNYIFKNIYQLQANIINSIAKQYDEPNASLVLGVAFGIKSDMGEGIKANLSKLGIMHVVVASGFNISLLIAVVISLLRFLSLKLRIITTVAVLLIYSVVAGFEAPIIRALIMGGSVFIARLSGRQKDSFLWLIWSAMIMIFINPGYLTDISFQLSFSATLGIICFSNWFDQRLIIIPELIREPVVTTIPAYLFTLPIITINFGFNSPLAILINALVLWCIPLITYLGLISGILGLISTTLGFVFVQGNIVFLSYFWMIIGIFT